MLSVSLPNSPQYEKLEENTSRFVIGGCYPGYGTTLGNSLRRVLLSSLSGNAAVSVKIKGVTHEFATIKGVKEDAIQIVLNLKRVNFAINSVNEGTIFLKVKGEKKVTAKDFKTTSEIEVVNPEQPIATLTTSSSSLDMEVKVEKGLGYVPVEQQEREEKEVGTIAIDAVYTPIKRVNFVVDNMRVGKRTDFDKITLDIVTDGTITPEDAYEQAVEILIDQYGAISSLAEEKEEMDEDMGAEIKEEKEEKKEIKEEKDIAISELNLSTRTLNILEASNVKVVSDIAAMNEEELREIEGMGDKGIKEIKKAIGTFGIILQVAG